MPSHTLKRADLSLFRAPTTRILFGERLAAVKQVQESIKAHGLMQPLTVMRRGKHLIIVDGKKRLAALRRLRFAGELPRSLANVPYAFAQDMRNSADHRPHLLSNHERFEQVITRRRQGRALMEIARELYMSKQCVKDLLCVARLSPRLQSAFFGGTISTAQARAFATLPEPDAQDQLLIALGPFAKAPEILEAIAQGEMVINMGQDNLIILPSRHVPVNFTLAA